MPSLDVFNLFRVNLTTLLYDLRLTYNTLHLRVFNLTTLFPAGISQNNFQRSVVGCPLLYRRLTVSLDQRHHRSDAR